MTYLTIEQVKREARRSDRAAIRCSIKHWEELRDAPLKDLRRRDNIWPFAVFCALCRRHKREMDVCDGCPLDEYGENCFSLSSVYSTALDYCRKYVNIPNLESEITYRKAAQEMVTTLKSFLE